MPAARLPTDEEERLNELRSLGVLDSAAEPAFDDLTRLAAQICQTPIALVSLIDADRQWFKSRVGLDATETPRDVAFCAHAILDPGHELVVPDALLDARFADNPFVSSPAHVRFYAGMPLTTGSGRAVGTLCVKDHVPRNLTPDQLHALRALGRQVVTQLELRRNLAELHHQMAIRRTADDALGASEQRFRTLAALAPVGIFETDADGRCLYVNERWCELTGLSREGAAGTGWTRALHPDDGARVYNAWSAFAASGGGEFVL
ncbi:MAG: PAS domain S-box protein, partial [Deltaproteobacteria bacterium]|nr:PAS domain S-box protein [Deltaproteobacteria bacterium]